MATPLRVLVAGCGGICNAWLTPAKNLPDVEIVGLMDIHEAAAREKQERHELSDAVVGTDLEAMLRAVKPDVVWNITIPDAHREVTLTALAHGCHVLSEKPLAESMASAREMVQAAKDAGKTFAVMQNRRYMNNIRTLEKFLRSGAIGKITTVNADFYRGVHFGGFRREMAHVLLLDMAIHTFDAARFIAGADPRSVYCHEWNPPGSWFARDAAAMAIFEMSDDIVYNYRGSWTSEGCNTTWESNWRIVGTHGSVVWNGAEGFSAEAGTEKDGEIVEIEPIPLQTEDFGPLDGSHAGCLRHMMQCIREGRQPETAGEDNIRSLAMVFGAIGSAASGRREQIEI